MSYLLISQQEEVSGRTFGSAQSKSAPRVALPKSKPPKLPATQDENVACNVEEVAPSKTGEHCSDGVDLLLISIPSFGTDNCVPITNLLPGGNGPKCYFAMPPLIREVSSLFLNQHPHDASPNITLQDGPTKKRKTCVGPAELPREELGLELFAPSRRRAPYPMPSWGHMGRSQAGKPPTSHPGRFRRMRGSHRGGHRGDSGR